MRIWEYTTIENITSSLFLISKDHVDLYQKIFCNFFKNKGLAETWLPTFVYDMPDYDLCRLYFQNTNFLIFSEKAKRCLTPLLGNSVEFLPLIYEPDELKNSKYFQPILKHKVYKPILDLLPDKPYYLINITNTKSLEAINLDHSVLELNETSRKIIMVERVIFYREKVQDCPIFKITDLGEELSSFTFISDDFKSVVEKERLTGLVFIKHPFKGNLVWSDEDKFSIKLNFQLFVSYLELEISRFLAYFSLNENNENICSFGVQYLKNRGLCYGFIGKEASYKDPDYKSNLIRWPHVNIWMEDYLPYYDLVNDFLEDFEDEIESLNETGNSEAMSVLEGKLNEAITEALRKIDFTHIKRHSDFEVVHLK